MASPYTNSPKALFGKKKGIHIKKKNRGKFTKYAKGKGKGVQEAASSVMANPDASKELKAEANFAIQAKKWHHE